MSQSIYDKTINHYITRTVLEPKLSKYLCNNNVATRKHMGTSYGIELLKKFIEQNKKYDKFYFLKLDINFLSKNIPNVKSINDISITSFCIYNFVSKSASFII